jgi:hypothetical protein
MGTVQVFNIFFTFEVEFPKKGKTAEPIDFQIASFAKRFKSLKSWFENCLAKFASII